MKLIKNIALVAHDNRKKDLIEWVEWNLNILVEHKLICTGTTGKLVEETVERITEKGQNYKYTITKLKSGPLGGDQQLGSLITEGKIDFIVFLWDPMQPQPHDVMLRLY